MKRTLALLLGLAVLLAIAPTAAFAEDTYSYSMVMYNFGPLDDEPVMEKYWEDKYGVDFNLVYAEQSSKQEQINLMVAAGEIPDVMQDINSASYFDQGIIGGWTEEFFREHAPKLSAYIDEIQPAAWGYSKFDGELMYSIPGFRLYNSVTSPIIIRTDWLEAVGVTELPKTLDEYESVFYKFANDDPDGNGQKDTYAISSTVLPAIYGAFGTFRGKWLPDGNGGVIYGDVKPETKEALTTLAKWYKDGVIDPEFITGENQGGYWAISHSFLNGKIGASGMGSFYHWVDATEFPDGVMVGRMAAAIKEAGVDIKYEVGYPPIGSNGASGTDKANVTALRTFFSAPLVADQAKFGRLLEIVDDMMMDLDNSTRASRGIPGETYEIIDWNGTKSIKMLAANNTDAINPLGAAAWFMFTEEYNYDFQYMAYAQDFAWYDKHIGPEKNIGYESAVYGSLPSQSIYKTECDKILNEGIIAIITGEKPVDSFEEIVSAWYAAGGQIMTDEAIVLYKQQTGN
jgi:putative aldouronate transport system substrate-binding protein